MPAGCIDWPNCPRHKKEHIRDVSKKPCRRWTIGNGKIRTSSCCQKNKSDSAHSEPSEQLVPQTPQAKSPPPLEDVALAAAKPPCTTSCSTSSPMTPPKISWSKQSVLSEAQIALIAKNKKLALERRNQNADVKRRREDEEVFQTMQWLP